MNLELPTPAGSPLGGHVVQGHVDSTATLVSLVPLHPELDITDWRTHRRTAPRTRGAGHPAGLHHAGRHQPHRCEVSGQTIEIAIIPHTYKSTNLHSLKPRAQLNVETDVLAKYAAQRNRPAEDWLTANYLIARGY